MRRHVWENRTHAHKGASGWDVNLLQRHRHNEAVRSAIRGTSCYKPRAPLQEQKWRRMGAISPHLWGAHFSTLSGDRCQNLRNRALRQRKPHCASRHSPDHSAASPMGRKRQCSLQEVTLVGMFLTLYTDWPLASDTRGAAKKPVGHAPFRRRASSGSGGRLQGGVATQFGPRRLPKQTHRLGPAGPPRTPAPPRACE